MHYTIIFVILSVFLSAFSVKQNSTTDLYITFSGLTDTKAPIVVSFYKPGAKFPSKKGAFRRIKLNPEGQKNPTMKISGLEHGYYAISCYHDLDNNEKMTTNFIHIPTEPTGFSNNVKIGFGPPSFDDCKFNFTAAENKISITLK